jgi:DNA mismatch repair ATPase MutS
LIRSARETGRVFGAVSATEGAFLRYGDLLQLIERHETTDPLLSELKARLRTETGAPSEAMARFRRIVGWFDLRHNALVYPLVNLVLLWDVQCALALERWQRAAGKHIRDWFDVIGWFEALASLAAFAADEPGCVFPELVVAPAGFHAEGLCHPLLPAGKRVENDVVLPGPGNALLVTGSNMSGKSTLLRAMGVSAVLAQSGAPVVARRLSLSPLTVCTSIRVADSLERGVSHFYAEITKLKSVLDTAKQSGPVLFLLDEVLHGTNSRERQIGARWLLGELITHGALGAVSTHDEELCRLPPSLMQGVKLVHLRESVQDGKMTFDYRVYPGPVTSGNALRLMQIVGLDVPLE